MTRHNIIDMLETLELEVSSEGEVKGANRGEYPRSDEDSDYPSTATIICRDQNGSAIYASTDMDSETIVVQSLGKGEYINIIRDPNVETPRVMLAENNEGVKFAVRFAEKHQREEGGEEIMLTKEPVVEFFDTRYPHTDYGQFVSSYFARTLLEPETGTGALQLDGGVSAWHITKESMGEVKEFITSHMRRLASEGNITFRPSPEENAHSF